MSDKLDELYIDTRSELERIEKELRRWADSLSGEVNAEKEIVAQYNLSERNYYAEYPSKMSAPTNEIQSVVESKNLMLVADTTHATGENFPFIKLYSHYEWIILQLETDTYHDYEEKHGIAVKHAEKYHTEAVKWIAGGHFTVAMMTLRLTEYALDMARKFKDSVMPYDEAESIKASAANQARLEKDPKQKEKTIVYEWWLDWQKHPEKYKGKAAFARDMIKDLDHTKDVRTITEKWCPEWEKLHSTG